MGMFKARARDESEIVVPLVDVQMGGPITSIGPRPVDPTFALFRPSSTAYHPSRMTYSSLQYIPLSTFGDPTYIQLVHPGDQLPLIQAGVSIIKTQLDGLYNRQGGYPLSSTYPYVPIGGVHLGVQGTTTILEEDNDNGEDDNTTEHEVGHINCDEE